MGDLIEFPGGTKIEKEEVLFDSEPVIKENKGFIKKNNTKLEDISLWYLSKVNEGLCKATELVSRAMFKLITRKIKKNNESN